LTDGNFGQRFMKELSQHLGKKTSEDRLDMPIIEDILSKNNVTTGNENVIRWKFDDVVLEYAKQNFNNESMYFVKDSKKIYWSNNEKHYNNNVCSVLKVENNKVDEIEISKKNMPENIGVNDVFREKGGKFIVDDFATAELQEKIKCMAEGIINKQNANIESYRKEGHLYMVSEELGDNRFLWDLTDVPKFEFEEVDIPKDLLGKAVEGSVLRFTNGTYEYYSNDGFERLNRIKN
jgi:hypothetical protein